MLRWASCLKSPAVCEHMLNTFKMHIHYVLQKIVGEFKRVFEKGNISPVSKVTLR